MHKRDGERDRIAGRDRVLQPHIDEMGIVNDFGPEFLPMGFLVVPAEVAVGIKPTVAEGDLPVTRLHIAGVRLEAVQASGTGAAAHGNAALRVGVEGAERRQRGTKQWFDGIHDFLDRAPSARNST